MRLWSILNALVFRGSVRLVVGTDEEKRVRLGVQSILRLLRPEIQLNVLPKNISDWPEHAAAWQVGGPPVEILRKIWTSTRGGMGARDIWDLTRALAKLPESEDLFVAWACLPAVASVSIGGKYGGSVAVAITKALEKHLPGAMVSANQLDAAAKEHFSELSVDELVRRYLLQLSLSVNMGTGALYAGVINHFLRWCGEPSERSDASYRDAFSVLKQRETFARKYIVACEEAKTMRVVHNGTEEDSEINLSLTGKSGGTLVEGGMGAVSHAAEELWEASIGF